MLFSVAVLYWLVAHASIASGARRGPTSTDTWTPVGPTAASIFALETDPFVSTTLYAGTYFGGLYRSSDSGNRWTHIPTPFSSSTIFAIVADPSTRGRTYVGTFQQGVFVSNDDTRNWTILNAGLTDLNIQDLAINPAQPNNLVTATPSGVFVTQNGGASWNFWTPKITANATSVAFDPTHAGVVYASTAGNGVAISTDSGNSWSWLNTGLSNLLIVRVRVSSADGMVYAVTGNGVSRLASGSDSWSDVSPSQMDGQYFDIARGPDGRVYLLTNGGILARGPMDSDWALWWKFNARLLKFDKLGNAYAASLHAGGLWASPDLGNDWYFRSEGFQNLFVGALAIAAANTPSGERVLAGTDSGVWVSDIAEQNWQLTGNLQSAVFAITPGGSAAGDLFAGTETTGVWKTADSGLTWSSSSHGVVPPQIFALGRSDDGSNYFAAAVTGLYVSNNFGNSWRLANTLGATFSIAPDPANGFRFIFGGSGAVFETTDKANSYHVLGSGLPPEAILGVHIAAFDRSYAVTASGGVYFLTPKGNQWQPLWLNNSEPALVIRTNTTRTWEIYLGTSNGGFFKSADSGITWTQSNTGIAAPFIFSVATQPAQPDTIYCGSVGAIYQSRDAGNSWTALSVNLPAAPVTELYIGPGDQPEIMAALDGQGIYQSQDGGQSWNLISGPIANTKGLIFLQDPQQAGTILAGVQGSGISVTRDGGQTWSDSSDGLTMLIRGLAGGAGQMSYAGALLGGVFRSSDSGASWQGIGLGDRNVFNLATVPSRPNVVYAGTSLGVSRSDDEGVTWREAGQRLPFATALLVDSKNANTLYVGSTGGQISRSDDGGGTWQVYTAGLPRLTVTALAQSVAGVLFSYLDQGGVYESDDGGLSWSLRASLLVGSKYSIQFLIVNPASGVLYAASLGAGVFLSKDQGGSWDSINGNLFSYSITGMAFDSNSSTLFVSTFDQGIFQSTDDGKTWNQINNGLLNNRVNWILLDPVAGGTIYAGQDFGVMVSNNGGASWQVWSAYFSDKQVLALLVRSDLSLAYATVAGVGILRSTDGGASWTPEDTGVSDLSTFFLAFGVDANHLYVGTNGAGVLRTVDGGLTWSGGEGQAIGQLVILALTVDSNHPDVMYAGSNGLGVIKSTNGGDDWVPCNQGLGQVQVLSLALDPVRSNTIYAGTAGGGVFISDDGCRTWQQSQSGLFNTTVTSLAVDPLNRAKIYAGTEGGGVFQLIRREWGQAR